MVDDLCVMDNLYMTGNLHIVDGLYMMKQWLLPSSGMLFVLSSSLVSQTTSLFTDSSPNTTSQTLRPSLCLTCFP